MSSRRFFGGVLSVGGPVLVCLHGLDGLGDGGLELLVIGGGERGERGERGLLVTGGVFGAGDGGVVVGAFEFTGPAEGFRSLGVVRSRATVALGALPVQDGAQAFSRLVAVDSARCHIQGQVFPLGAVGRGFDAIEFQKNQA